MFYIIWENIGKTFSHKISDKASTKNVFMLNCQSSIKGLFVGVIVFSYTLISIILYAVLRHKTDDTKHLTPPLLDKMAGNHQHVNLTNTTTILKTSYKIDYSIAILELLNLFLLTLSLFATIWSLIKIRKLNYRRTTTRK